MAATEVRVGSVDDFPEGQGRTVDVGGRPVAIFNVQGDLHAIQNTCLHKGGPLGEGMLEGRTVTCPWHGWRYDVATGENEADPGMAVDRFEVEVRDGDVYVKT